MTRLLNLTIALSLALLPVLARALPPDAPGEGAPAGATILLAADVWPPYNHEAGSQRQGFLVDVARLAFARHGCRVDYVNVSWDRAREGTLRGRFHGAVGATPVDGAGLLLTREPMARLRTAFLVRRGHGWRYTGGGSLEEVSLGCVQGYDYGEELNPWIRRHRGNPLRVQEIDDPDAVWLNLRKLAAGRVDAVADDEAVLLHATRRLGLEDELELAGRLTQDIPCTIGFTPAKPEGRVLARWLD